MKAVTKLLCGVALSTAVLGNSLNAAPLPPAQEGRRLFLKLNCYGCHGMRGLGGMGPALQGEGAEVASAVLQGKPGGMPSFSAYVTDVDLANLTAYVGTLGTPEEPVFLHWWEETPSE